MVRSRDLMRQDEVTVPERNPFRVTFFVMMAMKGISYGVYGVRTTPEHDSVSLWEQLSGVILLLSCIAVLAGLFHGPTWTRSALLRWGYLAFGISSLLFMIGSLAYGVDGWIAAAINALFVYAGFHDSYREYLRMRQGRSAVT